MNKKRDHIFYHEKKMVVMKNFVLKNAKFCVKKFRAKKIQKFCVKMGKFGKKMFFLVDILN